MSRAQKIGSLLVLLFALAGCWKKSGDALVVQKDFVPAAPIRQSPNESPAAKPMPEAEETSEPIPGADDPAADEKETTAGDDSSGPLADPRAVDHDQWIATVRMVNGGRLIDVRLAQPAWEKLQIGDQVHVRYREGKYTGTVWSAEID